MARSSDGSRRPHVSPPPAAVPVTASPQAIPAWGPEGDARVVIETPKGSRNKMAYRPDWQTFEVKRVLPSGMSFPYDFGFIPGTRGGDGDPLDVLVMNSRPLVPGAVVRSRPIGVLFMEDDGGQDEKILAVPVSKLTKMYDGIRDIGDMQPIQIERVKHFFTHYKDLEPGKWAKISHVGNAAEAKRVILESIERAKTAK